VSDQGSWARFERLRNLLLVLTAAWLPAVLLAAWWIDGRSGRVPQVLVGLVLVWTLAIAGVGLRLATWLCPRCGKPFFKRYGLRTFGERCPHCGLPYGSGG